MAEVEVRYFAAVADVTGRAKETIALPANATIGDLKAELRQRYPGIDPVLRVSAYLVAGELTRDAAAALAPRVDVLPPFAGG